MTLSGVAAEVTKGMVGVLLKERPPDILDRTYGDPPVSMFEETVRQIAAEVLPVAGPDPKNAARDLTVQCIAYGVASNIEYAEFPEQQSAGDTGRGYFLGKRFRELLDQLTGMSKDGSGSGGVSRATFPPPQPYPDPFGRPPQYRHGLRGRW
jgi:hypothetical protein